jgi:hypothetical protein
MSAKVSTKLLAHAGKFPQSSPAVPLLYLPKPDAEGNGNGHKAAPAGASSREWMRPWTQWRASQAAVQEFPLELNLVSKWRPWSVVTEQFRVAATRLTLMQGNRGSTVVVVTSAVKGEGKSAVAVNLAYVLARDLGKSTLIIDADLKRPVVHGYMGSTLAPGLQDVLAGVQSVEACLHSQETCRSGSCHPERRRIKPLNYRRSTDSTTLSVSYADDLITSFLMRLPSFH